MIAPAALRAEAERELAGLRACMSRRRARNDVPCCSSAATWRIAVRSVNEGVGVVERRGEPHLLQVAEMIDAKGRVNRRRAGRNAVRRSATVGCRHPHLSAHADAAGRLGIDGRSFWFCVVESSSSSDSGGAPSG